MRSSTLLNYSTGVEMGTWEVEIMTITDAACCYLTNICLQFSVLSGISFAVNLERFPCHCCGHRQHSPFIPIPMLLVSVPKISTLGPCNVYFMLQCSTLDTLDDWRQFSYFNYGLKLC